MNESFAFMVNNKEVRVTGDGNTPVLYVLRNELTLNGPRFGCGLGQCGACSILLDGQAVPSCQLTLKSVAGKRVTTLEGLIKENGELHAVQEAFIEEQAAQCGYCLNGFVINAVALLNENPTPSDRQIRNKINWNICRCGVHTRVIKAIKKAANS